MRRRARRRCLACRWRHLPPTRSRRAPSKADDAKKKLEGKRNELQDVQKRKQTLQTDVAGLAAERERLNSRLVETADLIKKSEGQLTTIETRLGELEEQERILKGSLNQRHDQIAKLLSALQRMGRNPPPVLITQREDALRWCAAPCSCRAAFPELGTQAKALTDETHRARARDDRDPHAARSAAQRDDAPQRCAHAPRRADGGEEGHARRAPVGAEAHAHCRHRHLAQRQRPQRVDLAPRPGSQRTIPGSAPTTSSASRRRRQTLRRIHLRPHSRRTRPPHCRRSRRRRRRRLPRCAAVSRQRQDFVELSPGATLGSPGRIKPEIAFSDATGRLPMPAQGRQVLGFGEKTSLAASQRGLCWKPGKAPKSRHHAMVGLFTLANFVAMANS